MRPAVLVALAVFAAVYVALAVPALPRLAREVLGRAPSERLRRVTDLALGRPGLVAAGALLLVLLGSLTPAAAWRSIDWHTLALLTGMMLLVAGLEAANTFAVLASHLARRLRTPARLLAGSMVLVAVLSALVLNDAVVLLFTPVLIRAARAMSVSAFPFLAGEAFAANLGSAATPTGNPQNAAIALARGLDFLAFTRPLLPMALAGLAIGVLWCLFAFRGDLARGHPAPAALPERVTHPRMLALALAGVALAFAGFLIGPARGIPLWASAFTAGLLVLVLSYPATRTSPLRIARSTDPGILAFFVGLFILLEGVKTTGLLDTIGNLLATGGTVTFVLATTALSNLVSNVPAVLLLLPHVATDTQALLLAATSTYAGNATFLGSAATVIVAQTARAFGEDFDILRFTLIGLPLAVITLALAWLMLAA